MEKLNTIQKVGKLNEVFTVGERGAGNAYHEYRVQDATGAPFSVQIIIQEGPRNNSNPHNGLLISDLLEISRDQLIGFQSGDFATDDNAEALKHIEIALMYLNKRTMDRYERDVLGTYEK